MLIQTTKFQWSHMMQEIKTKENELFLFKKFVFVSSRLGLQKVGNMPIIWA